MANNQMTQNHEICYIHHSMKYSKIKSDKNTYFKQLFKEKYFIGSFYPLITSNDQKDS